MGCGKPVGDDSKDECERIKLMNKLSNYKSTDLTAISVANLFNLIMVPIFIIRTTQPGHHPIASIVWGIFIAVLAVIIFQNVRAKRERWFILMPALFGIFLIVEVILDYVLKIDFRSTDLLTPYLILYYASILGMIGYSFLVEKKYGFITLVTYFLSQIAALYSYMKVGHG